MNSQYPTQHSGPHQRRPSVHVHHPVHHTGPYSQHAQPSIGGSSSNLYSTGPRSPTRQPEAPLTSGEIALYTGTLPYICSCGKSFRGRAQITAHVNKHPTHRDSNPGRNLLECPRKCGRMIDDMEDLVDHLERRHYILQDIRGMLTPFFDRPNASRAIGATNPQAASPLGSAQYSTFATQQSTSLVNALGPPNPIPAFNPTLTVDNLAYHRSHFMPTHNPGTSHPFACPSPNPSVFTTSTATTDSDTGLWRTTTGPALVKEVKPYTCKCGKAYKRRVDLEGHIQTPVRNHYDTTVYKYSCICCDRKHPTPEGMQKHLEGEHGMKYTCDDVLAIASAIDSMSLPSSTATPAAGSSKSSSSQGTTTLKPLPPNLIEYYSKLEPFKCKCGGSFTTSSNLTSHISRYQKKSANGDAHADVTGTNKYLHPCLLCNQFSFPTPKQLKAHLNDHHKTEYIK